MLKFADMKHSHKKRGFGLLEVLIAGMIIIIMLGALVVVARAALENSIYLQQRTAATYLAQEGLEIVRQVRDSNYIDGDNLSKWNTLAGTDSRSLVTATPGYTMDFVGRPRLVATPSPASAVTLDGVVYTRTVSFETGVISASNILGNPPLSPSFTSAQNQLAVSGNAMKAVVTVSWLNRDNTKQIIIEELITNSRQGF